MKLKTKSLLTVIFSILVFAVLDVPETRAQIQEILKRMEAHQKSLVTLRTKMTMEKYNAQLKEADVSEGAAIYFKSDDSRLYGRVDWLKPVQETLAISGNQYILYRPNLKQAITGSLKYKKENSEIFNRLSILSLSKKELKANHAIKYFGVERTKSGVETVHLEFKPKIVSTYQTLELWINKDGMPVQAKILETNNDFVTVLLTDFTKNTTMTAKGFKVVLPANTKVIKDSGSACVCPQSSDAKKILENKADAVFLGKIIEVKDDTYTFQVERFWKGTLNKKVIVESLIGYDGCALKLTKGEKYIVFAGKMNSQNASVFALRPCSLTSNLSSENGKKIVQELGKGSLTRKATTKQKRKTLKRNRK